MRHVFVFVVFVCASVFADGPTPTPIASFSWDAESLQLTRGPWYRACDSNSIFTCRATCYDQSNLPTSIGANPGPTSTYAGSAATECGGFCQTACNPNTTARVVCSLGAAGGFGPCAPTPLPTPRPATLPTPTPFTTVTCVEGGPDSPNQAGEFRDDQRACDSQNLWRCQAVCTLNGGGTQTVAVFPQPHAASTCTQATASCNVGCATACNATTSQLTSCRTQLSNSGQWSPCANLSQTPPVSTAIPTPTALPMMPMPTATPRPPGMP